MRVLAMDTALEACSVAVVDTTSDTVIACESVPMQRGHAEALMPMIARVLQQAGGLESIERLAVTVGPGSFTGIRVGLAAARGLALATKIPLVGLPTLVVMAAPLLAEDDGKAVAAAIDARHGRVFFQVLGPGGRNLVSARLITTKEAVRSIGVGAAHLVGSGAEEILKAAGNDIRFDVAPSGNAPDPVWLARLSSVVQPGKLPKPLYLRAPDAKPQEGAVARA